MGKEMLMRQSPWRDRSLQLDLFHAPRKGPAWHSLPMDVKEQTRLLLAQMLRMSPVSLTPGDGAGKSRGSAGDE
jgi:hypothetical protein